MKAKFDISTNTQQQATLSIYLVKPIANAFLDVYDDSDYILKHILGSEQIHNSRDTPLTILRENKRPWRSLSFPGKKKCDEHES